MEYDWSWDLLHTPSSDIHWQESDCYWFYDPQQRIGGFHRVGQQPNRGRGQQMLFAFKEGRETFLKVYEDSSYNEEITVLGLELDLGPDARQKAKQIVGTHSAESLGNGRMRYRWDEPGCSANLEFYESFHTPRSWSKSAHADEVMKSLNSDGHLECSGKLRGTIRIGAESREIDALCHRDRSWGLRDNKKVSLHRYRMFSGTVGPELSFATYVLDLKGGGRMLGGFVVRNGVEQDIRDLRVLTTVDSDGFTVLGSVGLITLDNGETLRIETRTQQGFMTPLPDMRCASTDNISTFTYNGKTGFMDLEMCINPGRGFYIPTQQDVTSTTIDQGLTAYREYIS